MDLGLVIIRLVVGLLFLGHGFQKLAGWFGGGGVEGTGQFMGSLGLRPGRTWAWVAGLSEAVGGALFALGFLNPLGPVLIIGVMLMAIARVHWPHGMWVSNNGIEYALTHIATALGVALTGPGGYSFDAAMGTALPVVPLLLFGLIGAIAVVLLISPAGRERREQRPV